MGRSGSSGYYHGGDTARRLRRQREGRQKVDEAFRELDRLRGNSIVLSKDDTREGSPIDTPQVGFPKERR